MDDPSNFGPVHILLRETISICSSPTTRSVSTYRVKTSLNSYWTWPHTPRQQSARRYRRLRLTEKSKIPGSPPLTSATSRANLPTTTWACTVVPMTTACVTGLTRRSTKKKRRLQRIQRTQRTQRIRRVRRTKTIYQNSILHRRRSMLFQCCRSSECRLPQSIQPAKRLIGPRERSSRLSMKISVKA